MYPGWGPSLPTLELPRIARDWFRMWDSLAEWPLVEMARLHPTFEEFIEFAGCHFARAPFVVFAFWSAVALMLSLSGATGLIAGARRAGRASPRDCARPSQVIRPHGDSRRDCNLSH